LFQQPVVTSESLEADERIPKNKITLVKIKQLTSDDCSLTTGGKICLFSSLTRVPKERGALFISGLHEC